MIHSWIDRDFELFFCNDFVVGQNKYISFLKISETNVKQKSAFYGRSLRDFFEISFSIFPSQNIVFSRHEKNSKKLENGPLFYLN